MNLNDEIEIYPSQKLMDAYKSGKPIEDVLDDLDADETLDEIEKNLGKYLAKEFYKKWEKENGK